MTARPIYTMRELAESVVSLAERNYVIVTPFTHIAAGQGHADGAGHFLDAAFLISNDQQRTHLTRTPRPTDYILAHHDHIGRAHAIKLISITIDTAQGVER